MNSAATPARRPLHPPPVPASPFPYHPGSLLSAMDLTLDGFSHILPRATALENQDPLVRRPHSRQAARGAAVLRVLHAHPHQL